MRKFLFVTAAVLCTLAPLTLFAAEEMPAAQSAYVRFSSANTPISALLDDAGARAVVEKHIPGLSLQPRIDEAGYMTLKDIQAYSERITDEVLAAIDADLAKL